ncbi:MAG: xanthine phosphoribosyltransferase [Fusobacteriaceae bacterium]
MQLLKDLILKDGKVIDNSILKVDGFLNHQIDVKCMQAIGKEFRKRFDGRGINKILTIEASGIAMAVFTALEFDVPLVFAKKYKPLTMDGSFCTKVHSFTKKMDFDVCVSKNYLGKDDVILIVDDFLAMGGAVCGLVDIVNQSGGKIAGVGIAIEKSFQAGRKKLEEKNLRVESLAIIKGFENGKVIF